MEQQQQNRSIRETVKIWLAQNNYPEYYISKMVNWIFSGLRQHGFLNEKNTVTTKGSEAGLSNVSTTDKNGNTFFCVIASPTAQEYLTELFFGIKSSIDTEAGGEYIPQSVQRENNAKLYAKGKFFGISVRFKKTYGEHTFTEEEIQKLLDGQIINYEDSHGNIICGRLQQICLEDGGLIYRFVSKTDRYETFRETYGQKDISGDVINIFPPDGGHMVFYRDYYSHRFSEDEIQLLANGKSVTFRDYSHMITGHLEPGEDQNWYRFVTEKKKHIKTN